MKKSLILLVAAALAVAAVLLPVFTSAPVAAGFVGAGAALLLAAPSLGLGDHLDALIFRHMAETGMVLGMTTLAANKQRAYELGPRNMLPVIAADIIYEGAAVGAVAGTGHARPLVAGDSFSGFAVAKADNSAG